MGDVRISGGGKARMELNSGLSAARSLDDAIRLAREATGRHGGRLTFTWRDSDTGEMRSRSVVDGELAR